MKKSFFVVILLLLSSNLYSVPKTYFIENKGQWAKEVRFLACLNGMNAWITYDGIVYDFYKTADGRQQTADRNNYELPSTNYEYLRETDFGKNGSPFTVHGSRKGHVVKMSFVGSKLSESSELSESYGQQFIGLNKSETYYNYFIGNDKSKWASFVPLYEEVSVKNILPGINTKYYFESNKLRYDFIIEPGTDFTEIKINFDFGEDKEYGNYINENGELVLKTSIGEVIQGKIFAYQEVDGNKLEVPCKFKMNEDKTIGFYIGEYNKNLPLIIDPLVWSTFLGGSGYEEGAAIALDSSKNIFVTGSTGSSNYPFTAGAYDSIISSTEVFFSKFNNTCSSLEYSTFLGGNNGDFGWDIALDKNNNVYIAGATRSPNFPVTPGAFDEIWENDDYFVCKFDSSCSGLSYSTFIGGSWQEGELPFRIKLVLDNSCNAYITGHTESDDFPVTQDAFDQSYNGIGDAFVSKLNSDGTSLLFSTYLGGWSIEFSFSITIDNIHNVYVTGYTQSDDFPVTSGSFDINFSGNQDCFVSKLDSTGSSLIYSTYIGGSAYDYASDIVLDSSSNAYLTGVTLSSNFPITTGAYDKIYNSENLFICKLNSAGSILDYSTFVGSNVGEVLNYYSTPSLVLNESNDAFVTCMTYASNFPVSANAFDNSFNGLYDAFLCKVSNDGSSLVYSTFIGGSAEDYGKNLTIDDDNVIYITGDTKSSNFPVTSGSYDNIINGQDAFVFKLKINDIMVLNIMNTEFCANETFDIPYVVEGVFKTGNKFIIQLSNAIGNFDNPISLDTIISTQSDTLKNIKLPDTLSSGTGYRIRIISTNPRAIGADNGTDITINELPNPSISLGDDSVCYNSSTVYSSSTGDDITYQWVVVGGNILGIDNQVNVTVQWTDSSSGTLTLSHTNTISGCSNTVSKVIVILPLPQPEISGADIVCNLSYEIYQGAKGQNIINKWQIKGGAIIGIDYGEQVMVLVDTSDKATLKLIQTDTVTTCIDSITHEITINLLPEPIIEQVPKAVCANNISTHTGNFHLGVENKWKVFGGSIIGSDDDDIVDVLWGDAGSGTLTLIQINTTTGCMDSATHEITINQIPSPSIGQESDSVCSNNISTHTGNSETGVENKWRVSGGTISGTDDGDTVDILWGSPGLGTITLIQTNVEAGCKDSVSIEITINPLPEIIFDMLPDICLYDEPLILNHAIPVGGSYSGIGVESDFFYPTVTGIGKHEISYSFTEPLTGCTNFVSCTITVLPTPPQPQISQQGKILISSSGFSYQWYNDNDLIENEINQNFEPDTTGYYSVIIIGENGCKSKMSLPYYFDITGIHDFTREPKMLRIYPNPSSDIVNIEYSLNTSENVTLELYDILGNKIETFDYSFVGSGRHYEQIDMKDKPIGMYYLILKTSDKVLNEKFGVMR
ncbi:MAG: SBBP repeat-containing protein [bacterium]